MWKNNEANSYYAETFILSPYPGKHFPDKKLPLKFK